MEPRRPGRPRKDPDGIATAHLDLRMRPETKDRFRRAAKADEAKNVSDWIVRLVEARCDKLKIPETIEPPKEIKPTKKTKPRR